MRTLHYLVAEVGEGSLVIKQAGEVGRQGPAHTVLGQHILSQAIIDGCGRCRDWDVQLGILLPGDPGNCLEVACA